MADNYGINIDISGNAENKIHKIKSGFEGLEGVTNKLSGLIGTMFVGFEAFEFIKESKEKFGTLEKSIASTVAVLNNVGKASGVNFGQMVEEMEKVSSHTLFTKSDIMEGEGILAPFTNIKEGIYGEAMEAIADYAAFSKTKFSEAASSVGGALQNPLIAIRQFKKYLDPAQKTAIQGFLKENKILEAQAVVLNMLKSKFHGVAGAQTVTDTGEIEMSMKKMDELKEKFGNVLTGLQVSLTPIFEGLIKGLEKLLAILSKFAPAIEFIIGLFIAWKTAVFFVEAAQNGIAFFKSLKDITSGIGAAASSTTIWAAGLLSVAAIFFQIKGIIDSIKFEGEYKKQQKELEGQYFSAVKSGDVKKTNDIQEQIDALSESHVKNSTGKGIFDPMIKEMQNMFAKITDNLKLPEIDYEGIKKKIDAALGKGSSAGVGDAAYNTSNLSGVSGGLGSAKQINIHIGNVMEINTQAIDSNNVKGLAASAAEEVIRQINNYAYSAGVM